MKYLAVKSFTDTQDKGYKYHTGDNYPRAGYTPTADRIEELSTDKNRRGMPMIKAVEEKAEPKKATPKKEEPTVNEKKEVAKPKKATKPRTKNVK